MKNVMYRTAFTVFVVVLLVCSLGLVGQKRLSSWQMLSAVGGVGAAETIRSAGD